MKPIAIAIMVGALFIAGGIVYARSSSTSTVQVVDAHNVSVTNGKQIVEIGVKGGYSPKLSSAKADMPTTLRMKTNATFDCSSGVVIPSLGYRQILPPSGETDIPVPAQKAGTTLEGNCVMGMYHFSVDFK